MIYRCIDNVVHRLDRLSPPILLLGIPGIFNAYKKAMLRLLMRPALASPTTKSLCLRAEND
ncbi:MAG: hypothetical protein ACK4XY_04225 [Chloroherpetonaceae bacterium]